MFMRSRVLQALQLGYGVIVGTLFLVHFAVYPVLHAAGIASPQVTSMYGWQEIAAKVRAAEARHDADFAAAASWGVSGRLSFALGGEEVPAINRDTDALDFWTDPAARAGQDAIVLIQPRDDRVNMDYLRGQFELFEEVEAFRTERWGMVLEPYELYLGRNYTPH